jgi:hypothetical protein
MGSQVHQSATSTSEQRSTRAFARAVRVRVRSVAASRARAIRREQIRANDLQRFEDGGTVRGPLADGQAFSEG